MEGVKVNWDKWNQKQCDKCFEELEVKEAWAARWKKAAKIKNIQKHALDDIARILDSLEKKHRQDLEALKAKVEALPGLVDSWFCDAPNGSLAAMAAALKQSLKEHFGEERG